MAINIYTVKEDVENEKWSLVSTTYKNLKTNLDLICPKGHQVQIPYDKWRKQKTCPECERILAEKDIRNKLPARTDPNTFRILALDAATSVTGYSIYEDGKLIAYGTHSVSSFDSIERINLVKHWLMEVCKIVDPDAIGIEQIQYQQKAGAKTFQTLANLQGVLMDFCFEHRERIQYGLISSSAWRSFLGINHGLDRAATKQKTQQYVNSILGINSTQDEADAICIGKYFCKNQFVNNKKPIWGEVL